LIYCFYARTFFNWHCWVVFISNIETNLFYPTYKVYGTSLAVRFANRLYACYSVHGSCLKRNCRPKHCT
jgi:hypothetical protein